MGSRRSAAIRRADVIARLELLVRADGGPLLQRLAREIYAQYGAAAGPAAAPA